MGLAAPAALAAAVGSAVDAALAATLGLSNDAAVAAVVSFPVGAAVAVAMCSVIAAAVGYGVAAALGYWSCGCCCWRPTFCCCCVVAFAASTCAAAAGALLFQDIPCLLLLRPYGYLLMIDTEQRSRMEFCGVQMHSGDSRFVSSSSPSDDDEEGSSVVALRVYKQHCADNTYKARCPCIAGQQCTTARFSHCPAGTYR